MSYIYKRWYAVRCCCTPKKIFGFLPLSGDLNADLRRGTYIVVDIDGNPINIRLEKMSSISCSDIDIDMENELAIYSEDRPIELWRRLKNFVEVTNP